MDKKITTKEVNYNIANWPLRTAARVFDYSLIFVFLLVVILLINANRLEFFLSNLNTVTLFEWQQILFTILLFFYIFTYFVLIQYLTKGYTLGKFIFKLRLISEKSFKVKFFDVLKHELFLTVFFSFIYILFPIITDVSSIEDIGQSTSNLITTIYGVITGGAVLFSASALLSIVFSQNNKGLHDVFSNTFVIDTRQVEDKKDDKTSKKTITTEKPGYISNEAISELKDIIGKEK